MSSVSEDAVLARTNSPSSYESQPSNLSQMSETVLGSQQNVNSAESSLPSTVVESQSQAQTQSQSQSAFASAPEASQGSGTVQDGASQNQPAMFSQATTISADNDSSMMPPPTPGGSIGMGQARSSGRAIKPTLKVRGDSEEPFSYRSQSNGSTSYGFRSRKTTQGSMGSSNGNRAPRLKLSLKGGHASRGKGDPTLAGVNKTLPYMQGYDRELDSSDDETGEGMAFEEQIILRMPEGLEATKVLGEWVRRREVGNDGREVEVKFKDSRRALFKMGDKQFSSKLVDLPAIIESHKTLDNKQMFKIADISQMLLVSHEVQEESEVTRGSGVDRVEGLTDEYVYDHGITPPMRWARKRRFRKRIHKRTIETVEKEVERLLAEDERAEKVEYTMIDVAEADLFDSDDDDNDEGDRGGRQRRGHGIRRGSPTASQADAQSVAPDGGSGMSDMEDEFSQMGEGEMGEGEDMSMMEGGEDDDVDQDLQRELEEEMLLQQQEDEEEEDEDGSTMGDRSTTRGRSMSRATSDDDEEEDEEDDDEDDLFDAGGEDEGAVGDQTDAAVGEEEEDDDDLDEEEQERRVRETQLEAECKEIEAMVKRKHNEVEGTNNALIKQRNLQTLKRMQTELDMKKSQLLDLKQQRKEGKEAAKAEAEAQAQAQEAAAAAAATAAARTSSSATPSAAAVAGATASTTGVQEGANTAGVTIERDKSTSATKDGAAPPALAVATTKKSVQVEASNDMDVDEEAEEGPEGEDDEDEGSDESDLFG